MRKRLMQVTRFDQYVCITIALLFIGAGQVALANTNLDKLFDSLSKAQTELEGRAAEDALWQHWFDQAPTAADRALLDKSLERREAYDFEAAENVLNQLVDAAPDYSEAYNQRAFIRFLRENYTGAKADLEKTLALEPQHFGAWAGMYLVLSRQSQIDEAFTMLQKAVSIHPWLKERFALPKALWPKAYRDLHESGQEI